MLHCSLAQTVSIAGAGIHCGQPVNLQLLPAESGGIRFVRVDLPGEPEVAADYRLIADSTHATTLRHGEASVSTPEHLLAALWCLGVTQCRVVIDGPEVPILDGSAIEWCRLIRAAGIEELPALGPRPVYSLAEPVWAGDGEVSLLGVPANELRLSVAVEFDCAAIGRQAFDSIVDADTFAREIAPARTFALREWLEPLRAAGLIRGGTQENAIVFSTDGPSLPLRFPDEVVRHKALDVLGDAALLFGADGGRLSAHLIAIRTGHRTLRHWMQECHQRHALVRVG